MQIGILNNIGYKHGNWHHTHWFQLNLTEHILNPLAPKKLNEVVATSAFQSILATANERVKKISG